MHSSIERERRLLDEKRGKWIARRMEMITKETNDRFQIDVGVDYRVNKQVEKRPATKLRDEIEDLLYSEQYLMELLLVYEVNEWEQLFSNKFKAFLDQIGDDRVEEKERLTREWRANCWKRLNPQMHAAVKRLANDENWYRTNFGERWASSIRQFFEGVEKINSISLFELIDQFERGEYDRPIDDEIRLRIEKEIEDTEFRLKRGSDLGRFDQFWDDNTLFKCRYSRSKWLFLSLHDSTTPLEIYSRALQGNKKIIHIAFSEYDSDSDINRFQATICDLPWVTSISRDPFLHLPIHRDLLFIKSINNDLITFAEKNRLKLDPDSTCIFTDADGSDMYSEEEEWPQLGNKASVLISFVAPKSGQSLILRLKHSREGEEYAWDYAPLEVTLGSTVIQLNPSSKSSLTIDDITLYPIQVPDSDPSESDHLSFEPGIRNDIVIQFGGSFRETSSSPSSTSRHGHILHDIELLDEIGREYMPRSA